jgi:hypothetical protein
MTPARQLRESLNALPGVVETGSRFSSDHAAAWQIDGREFAHLHSNSLLDLRLPGGLQARLRVDPRARFRRRPSAWVEFEFHSARDVADLLSLARQAAAAARQGRKK